MDEPAEGLLQDDDDLDLPRVVGEYLSEAQFHSLQILEGSFFRPPQFATEFYLQSSGCVRERHICAFLIYNLKK